LTVRNMPLTVAANNMPITVALGIRNRPYDRITAGARCSTGRPGICGLTTTFSWFMALGRRAHPEAFMLAETGHDRGA